MEATTKTYEDDMMDDVLDVDENGRRVDETVKAEAGDDRPYPGNLDP